jgi:hypothetical protein
MLSEQERNEHAVVEAALRVYPTLDAPRNFTVQVMLRVRASPRPIIRFRMPWLDLAVCVFFSMMTGGVFVVWEWIRRQPQFARMAASEWMWLRLRMLFAWAGVQNTGQEGVLLAGLILGMGALAVMAWLFLLRRQWTRI